MVGKLSSLNPLIERLKKHGISNYAVTEFIQGTKTRRWALGWSFGTLRPAMSVSRGTGSVPKALLPFPSEYNVKVS
jgi:23S rRNA (adenine1618-N6)-methyltransferase